LQRVECPPKEGKSRSELFLEEGSELSINEERLNELNKRKNIGGQTKENGSISPPVKRGGTLKRKRSIQERINEKKTTSNGKENTWRGGNGQSNLEGGRGGILKSSATEGKKEVYSTLVAAGGNMNSGKKI